MCNFLLCFHRECFLTSRCGGVIQYRKDFGWYQFNLELEISFSQTLDWVDVCKVWWMLSWTLFNLDWNLVGFKWVSSYFKTVLTKMWISPFFFLQHHPIHHKKGTWQSCMFIEIQVQCNHHGWYDDYKLLHSLQKTICYTRHFIPFLQNCVRIVGIVT